MEDLALIEKEAYTHTKQRYERKVSEGKGMTMKELEDTVATMKSYEEEDYTNFVNYMKEHTGEVIDIPSLKAKNKGTLRFFSETLTTLHREENKRIQSKREANRAEHPTFYIANGGGTDCFDYVGYSTTDKKIVTAFVDWDSGHGNEMLPDWEENDINELPESCIEDFKKVATEWIAQQCGCYFFTDFKGNLSIPCKVTTGKKFRGEGTLTHFTHKSYRDAWGRDHGYSTAYIVDKDGVEHEAVASRVEFEPGTVGKVVKKAVDNMTVGEIKTIFYNMLWHFGKYRSDCYPKIIKKAFQELNED